MKQDLPLVTVIIPVKNGGARLRECLSAVFSQRTDFAYDVLCVDRGSEDDSLEIIQSFPARLLRVDPATSGHGRTRNLAIQHSRGAFVAMLTQDAIPDDASWLRELLAPMRENPLVAGVFGRHKPHPGGLPSEAAALERHFARFGAETTLVRILPGPEGWAHYEANKPFYRSLSDHNAALRRSVWEQIPFRDVEFIEGQRWGADILEAGHTKAYAPRAVVRHGHHDSPLTRARRAFDEARSHRQHFDDRHLPGLGALLRDTLPRTQRDVRQLMEDPSQTGKLAKALVTVGRDVGQAVGWCLGDHHELLPAGLVRRLSQHPAREGDAKTSLPAHSLLGDVTRAYRESVATRGGLRTAKAVVRRSVEHYRLSRRQGVSRTLLDARRDLRPPPAPARDWWHAEQYRYLEPPATGAPAGEPRRVDANRLIINWVVPPPLGPGLGGHMTIFRTIQHLERRGHECRVYLVDCDAKASEPMRLQARVHAWYLPIRAPVYPLREAMAPADLVVATSWNTASVVRASTCAPGRVYFIQDYEPAFYSAGAEWQFAEDTYRFGFYGLTAGRWLEHKMREQYGMFARSFPLAVDHAVYYPEPGVKGDTRRIFAYLRPQTPRRGFQLMALALAKVKERLPDVEIHMAGSDVPPTALPFPFVGHGVLDFAALRRVFSMCDVGVCLSFTNYSLLPQEMAACGLPVVDLDGESTRAAYPPGAVVLAPPSVEGVAAAVRHLLEDEEHRQRQVAAGFAYVRELSWDTALDHAAEAMKEFALHATHRARPAE